MLAHLSWWSVILLWETTDFSLGIFGSISLHLSYKNLTEIGLLFNFLQAVTECPGEHHNLSWTLLHDKIKPISRKNSKSKTASNTSKLNSSKPIVKEIKNLETFASVPNQPKVSSGIDKNAILTNYQNFCIAQGIHDQATTIVNGKTSQPTTYPSHYCLISDCKMKSSSKLYHGVKNLHLDNVIIFLFKWNILHITDIKLENLKVLWDDRWRLASEIHWILNVETILFRLCQANRDFRGQSWLWYCLCYLLWTWRKYGHLLHQRGIRWQEQGRRCHPCISISLHQ